LDSSSQNKIILYSVRGLSTKSANHRLGQPGGVALSDKAEQVVGFRGALFGYFLGMQKVTKKQQKTDRADLTLRLAQGGADLRGFNLRLQTNLSTPEVALHTIRSSIVRHKS